MAEEQRTPPGIARLHDRDLAAIMAAVIIAVRSEQDPIAAVNRAVEILDAVDKRYGKS